MTTFGDFSSLLQLGVGIGIGLSLFRAPVDLRVARIQRTLDGEVVALRGADTSFAKQKRRDVLDLRYDFLVLKGRLDGLQMPFMALAVAGAVANVAALVEATLHADASVGKLLTFVLLFVSVGWFLLIIVALEILARRALKDISRRLSALQQRRAPPAGVEPTGLCDT